MPSATIRWMNTNETAPPHDPSNLLVQMNSTEDFVVIKRTLVGNLDGNVYSATLSWEGSQCKTIKAKWKELGPKLTLWSPEKEVCDPTYVPPVPEPGLVISILAGLMLLKMLSHFRATTRRASRIRS